MKRKLSLLTVIALLTIATASSARQAGAATEILGDKTRAVDLVICLDTSGTMDGLLDAARARVWDVVSELSRMKPIPELRVGLLTFGAGAGGPDAGWMIRQTDLTDDLDTVYAKLMALTIGGSEEFVGRAINTALNEMSWAPEKSALRILFVAGNESADQGVDTFDFRTEARAAKDRGIIINAMFVGSREQAIVEHWPELAREG